MRSSSPNPSSSSDKGKRFHQLYRLLSMLRVYLKQPVSLLLSRLAEGMTEKGFGPV